MSSKLVQNGQQSIQDWEGLRSKKFLDGIRTGYSIQSEQHSLQLEAQKRHFSPKYSESFTFRSSVRNYPESFQGQLELEQKGLRAAEKQWGKGQPDWNPSTRPLLHPQRLHVKEKQSGHREDIVEGLRVHYDYANQKHSYLVEDKLGLRAMVDQVTQLRNGIPEKSKGDKPYKVPEYETGFFETEGLATGQTQKAKKKTISKLKADLKGIKIIPLEDSRLWHNRQREQHHQQDANSISELDGWIENTLRKANPNYKDPDTFFDNMENQPVDKKGAKKK